MFDENEYKTKLILLNFYNITFFYFSSLLYQINYIKYTLQLTCEIIIHKTEFCHFSFSEFFLEFSGADGSSQKRVHLPFSSAASLHPSPKLRLRIRGVHGTGRPPALRPHRKASTLLAATVLHQAYAPGTRDTRVRFVNKF